VPDVDTGPEVPHLGGGPSELEALGARVTSQFDRSLEEPPAPPFAAGSGDHRDQLEVTSRRIGTGRHHRGTAAVVEPEHGVVRTTAAGVERIEIERLLRERDVGQLPEATDRGAATTFHDLDRRHDRHRAARETARSMLRRPAPALWLLAVVVAVCAACSEDRRSPTSADLDGATFVPDQVIEVDADGFDPAEVTVAPGDVLLLVNAGDQPHSFSADDRLDTGEMAPGDQTTVVFEAPGEIPYTDRVGDTGHVGRIVVSGADPGS
jgi:plastocyanin